VPEIADLIACACREGAVKLQPYQMRLLLSEDRFTWNCWARQTGKSFTLSLRRLYRALHRGKKQIILSAGERQSAEVMQKLQQHCKAIRVCAEFSNHTFFRNTSFRQLELVLPRGVRIIALPANPITARGFSGDVFLDEFAMHRDDERIWAALFPTLMRGSGELDIASTPRGCKNVFARLRENDMFRRETITLADAMRDGLDVDAAQLRRGIGDELAWRQEFCCEFLDETTSFFPYELIHSCQDGQLSTGVDWGRIGREQAYIYAGVDIGRVRDVTAVWLWEVVGEALITRGVVVLESTSFREQESVIAEILSKRNLRRCCIDATGLGMQLAERMTQKFGEHRVEGLTFTAALKSELAGRLRVLAERGQLRIPIDEAIERDWHSISRVTGSGGSVRFEADRSAHGHGDRFWAAALAAHAARDSASASAELGYVSGGKLTFARKGIW
jgi:phage FluMu gp28-like protein